MTVPGIRVRSVIDNLHDDVGADCRLEPPRLAEVVIAIDAARLALNLVGVAIAHSHALLRITLRWSQSFDCGIELTEAT